jgi:hypothetical protein
MIPRPELLRGRAASLVISLSSGEKEGLLTNGPFSFIIDGGLGRAMADRLTAGGPANGFEHDGYGTVVAWPGDPCILTDVGTDSATIWRTCEDLRAATASAGSHVYLVCASQVAEFASFVSEGREAWGRSVTPILLYSSLVVVGPTFVPAAATTCPRCWLARLMANIPSLAERVRRGHHVAGIAPTAAARAVAAARLLWEAPSPRRPRDEAMVLDAQDGTIRYERLLPVARCGCAALAAGPSQPVGRGLLGRCLGTVTAVGEPGAAPGVGHVLTARSRLYSTDGGAAGLDPDMTHRRALGEAAERIAATRPEVETWRASLRSAGGDTPSLRQLRLYTDAQYRAPDFPFRPLSPSDELFLVAGQRWPGGERVVLPAGLVTLDPRHMDVAFAPQTSTGIASQDSWPRAIQAALLELAERDLVTRGWYERGFPLMDPAFWVPNEDSAARMAGVRLRLAGEHSPPGVPLAVASVEDDRSGRGAFGSAAGVTFADAARHAVEDALLMYAHRAQRDSLLEVAVHWEGVPPGDGASVQETSVDWPALARHYRPVVVDLTTRETRSVGLFVASAWSPRAIDLPRESIPIPRAKWTLRDEAERRLARGPALFTG